MWLVIGSDARGGLATGYQPRPWSNNESLDRSAERLAIAHAHASRTCHWGRSLEVQYDTTMVGCGT
jgi:hypothetical protein